MVGTYMLVVVFRLLHRVFGREKGFHFDEIGLLVFPVMDCDGGVG